MSKNDGKEIEKWVRDCATENHWSLHRLADSKSAGRIIQAQPADYMGVIAGVPVLLECKSSERFDSFKDCRLKDFIKPTQFASFKMWERNRGCGLFVFHSVFGKNIEIWSSYVILEAYSGGWSVQEPIEVMDKKTLTKGIEKSLRYWSKHYVR